MNIIQIAICGILISIGNSVAAALPDPFIIADSNFDSISDFIVVSNLPKGRCQGEVPACTGAAVAFMIDAYNCKVNGITPCDGMNADQQVSALNAMSFGRMNEGRDLMMLPSSYTSVWITGGGVGGAQALKNAALFMKFKAESCYPLARLNEMNFTRGMSEIELFKRISSSIRKLSKIYTDNKLLGSSKECLECVSEAVMEVLGFRPPLETIGAGMRKNKFEEFLYVLMFGRVDCKEIRIVPMPFVAFFPRNNEEQKRVSAIDVIAKSREILGEGRPILLNEICTYRHKNGDCAEESLHGLVITGYKKMCKRSNMSECQTLFRVQNSMCGKNEFSSEAWLNAEALVLNIYSTPLNIGVLAWMR